MITKSPIERSPGFTLIEVMVVVIIVSLFAAAAVASIQSVTARQLQSDAESLVAWLTAASDDAQLGSSFRGIAQQDSSLVVIAPLNGVWYKVAHLDSWRVAEHIRLKRSIVGNNRSSTLTNSDADNLQPFLILSPMGLADPVGNIELYDDSQSTVISWNAGNFSIDGQNL